MSNINLTYKKLSLEEIIILSQKNDFKALEELIKREQKNVYATFAYLCHNCENVSDLTQEALFRVAKNIQTLKNPKHFKSWQNQIITHLYYDHLRFKQRKGDTLSIDNEYDESSKIMLELPDKKCKPNEKCLSLELGNIIKNAILSLPEKFKIVIVLREFQGLSYEEIAAATNASVGTVKSRIARARGKLQEDLRSYI